MPGDDLDFGRVIDVLSEEMHTSLHLAVNAPPEYLHNPGVQAGWGVGVLFGMHFACEYPRLASMLNRRLFLSQQDKAGPHKAADVLAEGVTEKVLFQRPPLTGRELADRLDVLGKVDEGTPSAEGDYWPLPKRPDPYHNLQGDSV